MATRLPQITSRGVQVQAPPNAVLPEVRFGQRDVSSASREQARYQGAVSDVIGRMTQAVFGLAESSSQRAGAQFAAENPLTVEQMQAMSRGDMSDVNLGSPLNVFNAAVRKARAIEVSGHAEAEATQEMLGLLEKANMGEMDADQVYGRITAITNGYAESLAGIDPDASFKFRASAAATGNRVLEKVGELDSQRRTIANTVKVQRMYSDLQQEIALAATTKMPLDQETGQEIPADVYIDALKQKFLNNTQAMIGVTGATQYLANIDDDINTAKVNAISRYLTTDARFANDPNAVLRLSRGDAGSASNAYQALLPQDQARVVAAYMTADGQNYALQKRRAEEGAVSSKREFTDLYVQYAMTDDPAMKQELFTEMFNHPSLTLAEAKSLMSFDSSVEGEIIVEGLVRNGQITTEGDLHVAAEKYGVSGTGLGQIFNKFRGLYSSVDGTYIKRKIKQAANVPEGLFTIDPKSDYARKMAQYENEFMTAQNEAIRRGESFDPKATVDRIADNAIKARASVDATSAKNQLDAYQDRIGGRAITLENFEALSYQVRQGTETRINKTMLPIIEDLLRRIEGL